MPARRVTALLAAAGKGSRLGAPIPKAFVSLRGVSLVERSIRGIVTSDVVDQIIVLVSPDMEDYARELFAKRGVFGLSTAAGNALTVCGLVCRPLKKTMALCSSTIAPAPSPRPG